MIDLALYQPEIPGNAGTLIRLSACLGTRLHIIEPASFRLDDAALRRSQLDYAERAVILRHDSFADFRAWQTSSARRLILATTRATVRHIDFAYRADDVLLFGRESAGVPDSVHELADGRVRIAMADGARSINLAVSGGMLLGEALRQTGGFPA